MKITIPIPPPIILEAKIEVAKKLIGKLNQAYKNNTDSLHNSIGWQVHEGKVYILKGMDIIAII